MRDGGGREVWGGRGEEMLGCKQVGILDWGEGGRECCRTQRKPASEKAKIVS